jgi:hypothetical protein
MKHNNQRRIFIFLFAGVDKYLGGGGGGCCCLLWPGVVATPGKAKEKV